VACGSVWAFVVDLSLCKPLLRCHGLFFFSVAVGFICASLRVNDTCVDYMSSLQLGSTAIGLKTKYGIVLVVEKRVTSPLLVIPL
jgi:hypothetical protein